MNRANRHPLGLNVLRTCLIGAAALLLGFVPTARATPTNLVVNPGFEQACGGQPAVPCDWLGPELSQDTNNPHSGAASGHVLTFLTESAGATSSCTTIVPGPHAASFWFRSSDTDLTGVYLEADFFSQPDCAGANGLDRIDPNSFLLDDSWQEGSGTLVAPVGTVSVRFAVEALAFCGEPGCPAVYANFDDLDVEDTVVATPAIGSFAPQSGPAGTRVDIRGWNFSGTTSVTFNGTSASFTVDSDSEIHAVVPAGANTGPISLTTGNGSDTSDGYFMVSPAPRVGSFTPTSGPVGTSVDISGEYFTGASAVTFNGTPASFTVNSDGWINAIVPAGATTGQISVTTPSGAGTSLSSFTVGPPAPPGPVISSFTPASGPVGTVVSIFGANFTGVFDVRFMDTPAIFTFISDSEIRATVPAGAETGQISVETPYGVLISTALFTVSPNVPPVARFTFSCTGLTCTFDGSSSYDPDGSLATYAWNFGDGASTSGATASHAFGHAGSYTVTLSVTDNSGATRSSSTTVNPISLTARSYRQNGHNKVDLSWNDPGGPSFDVFRNGVRIATVQGGAYTDTLNKRGTYAYKVCAGSGSACSNTASVSF